MTPPKARTAGARPVLPEAAPGRQVLLLLKSCGCVSWHDGPEQLPVPHVCPACGFHGVVTVASIPAVIPAP